MRRSPLVIEGDLTFYNEDHYVCDGDPHIAGQSLTVAIGEHFNLALDHNKMGAVGAPGKVWAKVRVTVERL